MVENLVNDIIPKNDEQRVEALKRYDILDTPPEESFDNIVRLMADVFNTPIALISLVDKDRVFFKGNIGMPGVKNTNRNVSLCSFAILSDEPTVFERPLDEPCLLSNPLVHGEFGLRFYAGAPLITSDGFHIGSVCIVDKKERNFSEKDKSKLARFASLVMHELELRFAARAVNDDAKEQALARKSAEEIKDTLSIVLEAVPEKGWTANVNGEANFLTKGWYEYTGQAAAEAEGRGWTNAIHPDDVDDLSRSWMRSVQTAQPLRHEARIRNKSGEYRWHLIKSLPIHNRSGTIFLWGGTCTDIHDRKIKTEELERKVWERTVELERSNKSLEEFAYAASHDLKAPIRKISTFSERLKDRVKEKIGDKDMQFYLERIDHASRRMNTLIDDLLTYSSVRRGLDNVENVDLNESIRIVFEDLELELQDKNGKVTVQPLPSVKGYRRQLQQAFQNILSNSLKYSKAGIPPEIHISYTGLAGKDLSFTFPGIDLRNQYYLIEVQDNGIGFGQQDAERIFNVFTRLHGEAEYSGTGVGLSIV